MFIKTRPDLAPEFFGARHHIAVCHTLHLRRKISEQGNQLGKKQRQVIFDTGTRETLGDIVIQRALAHVHRKRSAERLPEICDRCLMHWIFTSGQQPYFLDLLAGYLGFGRKLAQAVDKVIKELNTIGCGASHRKQVHDRTAYRKFAMFINRIHALVTCSFKGSAHVGDGELLAGFEDQAVCSHVTAGWQAMEQGGDGKYQDAMFYLGQQMQGFEPVRNNVLMR